MLASIGNFILASLAIRLLLFIEIITSDLGP
jgi:hypothetical protein